MSGGVDSAVAAFLLKRQGHDVTGANMRFWEYRQDCASPQKKRITSCCSPEDLADAERSARGIGIPFYALKMEADFREKVIDPFIADYAQGLTPNPCVHCNTFIKFGEFYRRAHALGFDAVATGHYAAVTRLPNGRYAVAPAKDRRKDQSYYLYGMSQEALSATIFPLAELTKDEVRRIAAENRIPVAQKPDSQEICFIPDNDHRAFLRREQVAMRPGYFRNREGAILGRHAGAVGFTVGQRRGLGLAAGTPLYVLEILQNGDIVVGPREDLERRVFYLRDVVYQGLAEEDRAWQEGVPVLAQIRYNSAPQKATAFVENGWLRVEFESPAWAITPGQAGVLFHPEDGYILAGGKIRLQRDAA